MLWMADADPHSNPVWVRKKKCVGKSGLIMSQQRNSPWGRGKCVFLKKREKNRDTFFTPLQFHSFNLLWSCNGNVFRVFFVVFALDSDGVPQGTPRQRLKMVAQSSRVSAFRAMLRDSIPLPSCGQGGPIGACEIWRETGSVSFLRDGVIKP